MKNKIEANLEVCETATLIVPVLKHWLQCRTILTKCKRQI